MSTVRLHISGVVQGVGFRPAVLRIARAMGLRGYVTNTASGVEIHAEGDNAEALAEAIRHAPPPLARITEISIGKAEPGGYEGFSILPSRHAAGFTLLSPDVSMCGDCGRELFDPADRRYLYPFINCTNCGPRYSITLRVPYDRPNTTMAEFRMCPACEREYVDPEDRRFHAQPIACPACGPHVWFVRGGVRVADRGGAISMCIETLRDGRIVAIKGLGGFHLACDASDESAVRLLRERKRRVAKPFALMARDLGVVRQYACPGWFEEELLKSERRPVVLLERIAQCGLPEALAPGNGRLGFMLPCTPLHEIIMREMPLLVMTSGNRSEEPIQTDNGEALEKLSALADGFLLHDRGIFMRVDDSVVRTMPGHEAGMVRRSRGYAPEPIPLGDDGPDVLAVGADLKNTFTLMKGANAIVSQHIGDMENHETLGFFEETLANLKQVYRAEPVAVAHDLHPDYHSTRWALGQGFRIIMPVQHHYAHVASVMAEHGLRDRVVGVALDGTGYGTDGNVWGGEFLVAGLKGFYRGGRFAYVPLPGGEMAAREPWRMAVSHIHDAFGDDAADRLEKLGFFDRIGRERVMSVLALCAKPGLTLMTSSAGRLFDAVSSICGLVDINTFEAEAAMAIESAADKGAADAYGHDISYGTQFVVDFSFMIISIVGDVLGGVPPARIAARFQSTVAEASARVAAKLALAGNISDVCLSGGVFQNAAVEAFVRENLAEGRSGVPGLRVRANRLVPPNDGGVSLGQACVLRARMRDGI